MFHLLPISPLHVIKDYFCTFITTNMLVVQPVCVCVCEFEADLLLFQEI